ncbi:MAG: AAA family ATPase [Actinomycetota bacterium]|nr:AAA family ATPase [Actinomycetota bacterium]
MTQEASALAGEWRKLTRAATAVALLTSPAWFVVFQKTNHWPWYWALLATFVGVIAFRGAVDVIVHKLIPTPNLYGAEKELLEEDVVQRRRVWYWRTRFKHLLWLLLTMFTLLVGLNLALRLGGTNVSLFGTFGQLGELFNSFFPTLLILGLQLPLLFFINFAILFGPLLFFGIKQMKVYEPGDADWGVRLDDVRGQQEPKEEVTRVISLWQAGEEFEKAGGKRERGLLFLGAPGTGKTMLSKAIATSFNCPFMTMPGSGFAQTFIGMDVVVVLILIARARRMARKWGGQCIVFIDEIDAVGTRRAALGGGAAGGFSQPEQPKAGPFYGPWGSLTASGDVIVESREWRDYVFAQRAAAPQSTYPPFFAGINERINRFIAPGMMGGGGGGMALNQLLVQMDGVDEPPFMRRFFTKRINTFLDAMYVFPRRLGKRSLRLPSPKPRNEQIYFIGATNAPMQSLDPALIRPGRMGRHIFFRTPTKDDRRDILDLYIAKVDHQPDLDTDHKRDELARITSGYSPAMIEQVCSMALTYAHSEGRERFGRPDILEAMTTIESGTAQKVEYVPAETRAVAIHEAGHAVGSFLYQDNLEATRLTVRKRGESLGHFQMAEKEERFSAWQSEVMANLIMTLGAMAAEYVFYDENSVGVGGDVYSATFRTLQMVGAAAMGPRQIDLGDQFASVEEEEAERERITKRLERIGNMILHRSDPGAGSIYAETFTGVMTDPSKRALAAQIIGQAFIYAYNAMRHNRRALSAIADELVDKRELHGDDVISLLERVRPVKPTVDWLAKETWPKL